MSSIVFRYRKTRGKYTNLQRENNLIQSKNYTYFSSLLMTLTEKCLSSFEWENLLEWYEKNGRHTLPWRQYKLPASERIYRVWLSEILLQQTQASRVVGFFERMIERFPHIENLAEADYDTFFRYYQGLGYYSRARNILKTANIISNVYGGIFPSDKHALIQLPGVGEYTSQAILAFGYGKLYLAWDTNLEKVFARYYHGSRHNTLSNEEKAIIETDFHQFIKNSPQSSEITVRNINNALMDFSSLVDLKEKNRIDWKSYPLRKSRFFLEQGENEIETKKIIHTFPTPDANVEVILHRDHQEYYSENPETYTSFLLPPALHRDTRKYVQDTFRERYGLELSVRPAHKKWITTDGVPYISVNAQIQQGVNTFSIYTKQGGIFAKKEISE